jgi:hypothetical protein
MTQIFSSRTSGFFLQVFKFAVSAGAGLRDHDPDQYQEQHGCADQIKGGLHQIHQRKGADLTCKAREVD